MSNKVLKDNDIFVSKLRESIMLENEERRIKKLTLEGVKVENQIIECAKCGNKGKNKVIASHPHKYYEYINGRKESYENSHIYLLECPVCSQITLISYEWNTEIFDKDGEIYVEKDILYPKSFPPFPNTPEHIVEAYESARKTMYIDNSISLIAARKVLELICKDKGSKKKNLESMLNEMVSKNVLPATMDKCGLLIRKLGNAGAHDDIDDFYVSTSDLEELMDFIETIIYYIYELPVKISKLNEKYL